MDNLNGEMDDEFKWMTPSLCLIRGALNDCEESINSGHIDEQSHSHSRH